MREAMESLWQYREGPALKLINILFGIEEPSIPSTSLQLPCASTKRLSLERVLFEKRLNDSQIAAVEFALEANELALIHGPPGTGKTTTVVEIILQMVSLGYKVLVCAPSNIAVDNILEKLDASPKKPKLLRIGHPARIIPALLKHSLDIRISTDENTSIVNDVRKDMDKLLKEINQSRNGRERKKMRGELNELRRELQRREAQTIEGILQGTNVILATNSGAADRSLKNMVFDVVIIDEAAQALECSCWIPILKGRKLILAGGRNVL